jgi:hypothetical protein
MVVAGFIVFAFGGNLPEMLNKLDFNAQQSGSHDIETKGCGNRLELISVRNTNCVNALGSRRWIVCGVDISLARALLSLTPIKEKTRRRRDAILKANRMPLTAWVGYPPGPPKPGHFELQESLGY